MTGRVLIVSPHFPPDSNAGTHRVRLLAPHLETHGWEPTVLTVDPRDYEGPLDGVLQESVPPELRVVRARAWPAAVTRRLGVGDLGIRAFSGLFRTAARLLGSERFDVLFITTYPVYPAMLGPMLKKRFGVAFVLDYQDPWVGEWGRSVGPGLQGRPDLKSRLSRAVAARLEPIALRAADGVTAVSRETCDEALRRTPDAGPRVVEELPIGWDRRDLEFLRRLPRKHSPVPQQDGLVHLSYVGTVLPTGLGTLHALLTAVGRLRVEDPAAARRLRLHFVGTSNQRAASARERVLPIARDLGVADLVTEVAPRLDYFEALQFLADSTVVLLLGSRERHYTPSKVFSALLTERPILALYHQASTVVTLLRACGGPPDLRLITFGDGGLLGAEIDALVAHLKVLSDTRPDFAQYRAVQLTSASFLAGRLARVLTSVAAGAQSS
jgi:glycosyltransferase involved in cell wall biosynthesis